MTTGRITQDGQIAVPKDVLRNLHVRAGDTVGVEIEGDGTVRIFPKVLRPSEVAGMLALRARVKSTVEEMDEAVAEAFRKGEL
jgi:AbrB family looped-hinge helix DNA binding protein